MSKILPIGTITKLDVPSDDVLRGAIGKIDGVVLIGFDSEGELYFASSYADGGTVMWLLESCKKALLET